MGWVRGQTGEQKRKEKQRKDLPGLGSGGIPAGRLWLDCGHGHGCLQESCITGWERDSIRDPRYPIADLPGGSRVGAAQGLLGIREGGEERARKGGRRGHPQGIPALSDALTSLPAGTQRSDGGESDASRSSSA